MTLKDKIISENLTIFYGGRVYDFMTAPSDVTVFEPAQGRFLLLDPPRKFKTEVSAAEIAKFMDQLRDWAKGSEDKFMNFLADPRFEQKFEPSPDRATGLLTMTSPYMAYQLRTAAAPSTRLGPHVASHGGMICPFAICRPR